MLTLTNGTTVDGVFGGNWKGRIEIMRAVLADKREEGIDGEAYDELQ